jgi:uncharacterized protein
MSSNPSQPAPQWRPSGPVSPGPRESWPAGPGRWPTTRAPWPDPDAEARPAEPGTGAQARTVTREDPGPEPDPSAAPGPAHPAGPPGPAQPGDERLATLTYLGVPFLGPVFPLGVYLIKRHASAYVRGHSVQALNLSITALLYTICVLIVGGMLALDSLNVAFAVAVPLAAVLWLATLVYVIRAGAQANRGGFYRLPSWICATVVR